MTEWNYNFTGSSEKQKTTSLPPFAVGAEAAVRDKRELPTRHLAPDNADDRLALCEFSKKAPCCQSVDDWGEHHSMLDEVKALGAKQQLRRGTWHGCGC